MKEGEEAELKRSIEDYGLQGQVKVKPRERQTPDDGSVEECMRAYQRGNSISHVSSSRGFLLLLTTCRAYDTAILRVEIAVDVVLLVPETVHSDPMTQSLHLFPYVRVPLLNPGLDLSLLLDIGRRIVPITEAATLSAWTTS